ncbi:MAG: aldo/keto reductase, partial [Planctomycetes bacterium SM23_65]
MEYRRLGMSDLKVSAITLGAWGIGGFMWGGQREDDAIRAIQQSIDLGVTTIDTAPVYGTGRSEERVGKGIASYPRDKLQILTKYGLRWDGKGEGYFSMKDADGSTRVIVKNGKRESIIEECEASLKRLGTDYIDLYQQHWPLPNAPVEESMEAVDQLLKQGKIRAVGVSNFDVALIERARKVVPIASLQPPYSMINRGVEDELLPYCVEHRIGVVVYSPLQRGLLTGKVTMDRQFPETDHRGFDKYFKPGNRRKVLDFLEKIKPIAQAHDATLAQ